jgi:hypothetical protein
MKYKKFLTGVVASVVAFGAVAGLATPSYAAVEGWHEVEVTTAQELTLAGTTSEKTTLSPSVTGLADIEAAGALGVRANIAWKLQWQAVTGHYNPTSPATPSTTGANGTYLTTSGFGAAAANASLQYSGTNTDASGTNVWSAKLATTGDNQTLGFTALQTSLQTIWTGTATTDASLTPTYSADIDSTLTNATYYGTIYYKLTSN